ncbi:MAG: carbohydrate ABC transporter permease [Bacilli bacterium]
MKKSHKICWSFIGIGVILWSCLTAIPFIQAFFVSLQSCTGNVCHFGGMDNYIRLLHDRVFWQSLFNVTIYLIIEVPIMVFLGLILASIMNMNELRGKTFFRTSYFLPMVTAAVGYSIVFKMIFSNDGIANSMLLNIGLMQEQIHWLSDPIMSKLLIIISLLWKNTGYDMMLFLAAMQNVPRDTYEAAWIDGSSSIRTFFQVTIPQIKPVIFFSVIMSTIGTIQMFDEAQMITGGGPGYSTQTLSQYIYSLSFERVPDFGYAAAISFVIVIFVVILALIQKRVYGKDD